MRRGSYYSTDRLHVVTFETDLNHINMKKLTNSLNKYSYEYHILSDKEWKGFGTKIVSFHEYLKSIDPEQIVVFCDARDVLCVNHNSRDLIEKFKTHIQTSKVVVSTEIGCCVPSNFNPGEYRSKTGEVLKKSFSLNEADKADKADKWKEMFKLRARDHDIMHDIEHKQSIHLNSGMYMGRVKDIMNIHKLMNIDVTEDDQLIMSEVFYHHPHLFHLDYNRDFFSNSHVWDTSNESEIEDDPGCYYKMEKGKIIDTYLNSEPFFIQTPGKHYKCLDSIEKIDKIY